MTATTLADLTFPIFRTVGCDLPDCPVIYMDAETFNNPENSKRADDGDLDYYVIDCPEDFRAFAQNHADAFTDVDRRFYASHGLQGLEVA